MAPAERLELRRHLAAAAGMKEPVLLSLFMEVDTLENEEELSTMATFVWTEGNWMGRWARGQTEAWRRKIFEAQAWRPVRGHAGAVTCETRDLGIKWACWHTLMF